jgi:hypothetical protein
VFRIAAIGVLVALGAVAHADVPDASLRAVSGHVVRLELDGSPAVEGRVLAFEAATVTLTATGSNEVVTVPRDKLQRMIAIEVTAPAATTVEAAEKMRVFGLQFSLLGTVAVDADYKLLHGFASTSLLLPIVTASGNNTYVAAAVGGGVSIPMGKTSRWKLDVFGEVLPLHTTSYYTYLAFGVGAGFHYTASSGFTIGFTVPVIGFSTRLGSSPTGYDASFRYNDSVGYYYLAAVAGMPLITMGYRFATNCPRRK